MTRDEAHNEIIFLLKKYRTARKNDDLYQIQDVRDGLSEALLYFGMFVSQLKDKYEVVKIKKSHLIDEFVDEYVKDKSYKRGSKSDAEREARIKYKEMDFKEQDAYSEYYEAKTIIDRADQILNGISSRLKVLLKNEQKFTETKE